MTLINNHDKIRQDILAKLEYEDLLSCMRCGMCVNKCPTFRVFDKEEAQSPRGRIALMRAVYEGKLEPTESFKRALDQCLVCKKCVDVCPSKVKYIELITAARKIVE